MRTNSTKLNEQDAKNIRELYEYRLNLRRKLADIQEELKNLRIKDLAKKFDINPKHFTHVGRGDYWNE